MNLWESVRIALRALRGNKLRTGLTMLGIVIGVGAVIAMIAIGQGAADKIKEQFSSMGTNLLVVRTGNPRMRFGAGGPVGGPATVTSLVPADAQAILDKCQDTVEMISQVSRGSGTVKMGDKTYTTSIVGATPEYETVDKWPVELGRFTSANDEQGRARVAVVGRTVVEDLTPDRYSNPIGQNISINRTNFEIIGILQDVFILAVIRHFHIDIIEVWHRLHHFLLLFRQRCGASQT